jgi:hypothetical protein
MFSIQVQVVVVVKLKVVLEFIGFLKAAKEHLIAKTTSVLIR